MLGGLDYHSIAAHVKRALSIVGIGIGPFQLTGAISPAQLVANTNDWAPTGLENTSVIRFSTDASRNITGLTGGADGRIVVLHNVGSQPAVLKDEDANSAAGNRFGLDADVTLLGDQSITLQYDSTSSRWRQLRSSNGEYRSVRIYTANDTWTQPAGLKRVKATVVGGGGSGGGAAAPAAGSAAGGSGGGGGGTSIKTIAAASLGATETVTVGAGGAAATAGNNSGNAGGTSSFGAHCSATGGAAGAGGDDRAEDGFTEGNVDAPTGGVGSGGDLNLKGSPGTMGIAFASSNVEGCGGNGGASFLGGGGQGRVTTASSAGVAPGNYGGGSAGGSAGSSGSAAASQAGAAGVVIVEEFF